MSYMKELLENYQPGEAIQNDYIINLENNNNDLANSLKSERDKREAAESDLKIFAGLIGLLSICLYALTWRF